MSIAYVGQSHAKSGQSDKLREFMRSVVLPAVRSSSGCESCLMLQSEDDPTRFIGIEVWTSIEAHRAAIAPLTELVSAHGEPGDHEMLGICHLAVGNEESASAIFKAGLAIERERSPQSDLCGTLMKRVSML